MELAYMAELPKEEFEERRTRVLTQMQPNSVLLLFSEIEKRRNNDCTYPFRQDSYFWYLTGFNEPNAALLLLKTEQEEKAIIFLRPRDPFLETWNGRRLGVEHAPQHLNVNEAYSIEEFVTVLPKILKNLTALYYVPEIHTWGDKLVAESAVNFIEILDWRPMLSEMRLIKSPNEIRLMQQAGQITALGHIKAMQTTRPNRLNMKLKAIFCMNLIVIAPDFLLTIPLLLGETTPVFCTTQKMIAH